MKPAWGFGVFAFLAASICAGADTAGINAFIEDELPESAAPGLAYALVEDGEVAARGFGEQVQGSGRNVAPDTLFPIGSVTKSFTALAVMQLVEAGSIALDDPVSRHVPAFASGPANEVTVRQLLDHTSGYSTVQGNSHHGSSELLQDGLVGYAGRLARVAPAHAPGTIWEYSNANYQILGALIEQASGLSYADYVDARILQPLGMTDTVVVVGRAPPAIATGHRPWFGGVRAFARGEGFRVDAPAGGIVSSAPDMGRYLAMWMNGRDDIVSARTKSAMLAPSGPVSPHYGLGWNIDAEQGTVYHTGLVPGFETLAAFAPGERKGVVVLVNANSGLGFADTWHLIGGVAARAMGQAHEDSGSRWGPKSAYLSIALLPPLFAMFAIVSWRGRSALRAKRWSTPGKLSLWLPLPAMGILAWFLIAYIPRGFGGSLATLRLYQPDFALCLIASAILAPAWAAFRLAISYSDRRSKGSHSH